MWQLCSSLHSSLLWAQPVVLSSEVIDIQIGATWSFPIVQQENLYIAMGQQGRSSGGTIGTTGGWSWDVEMEVVFNVTIKGKIVDHALRQCPDGTFIHVSFVQR